MTSLFWLYIPIQLLFYEGKYLNQKFKEYVCFMRRKKDKELKDDIITIYSREAWDILSEDLKSNHSLSECQVNNFLGLYD